MTSEDPEALLKQISQLAGQINRHKNGQASGQEDQTLQSYGGYPQSSSGWRGGRATYRGFRGGVRGQLRGGRGNHLHRNKSLVLNAGSPASRSTNENIDPAVTRDTAGWVSKTERGHRQIVNPAVFEKETAQRVKQREGLRLQKLLRKDQQERARLEKRIKDEKTAQVNVGRGLFRVCNGGRKLKKISGTTPKMGLVSGIKFFRSKNGNMYRDTSIKIQGYGASSSGPTIFLTALTLTTPEKRGKLLSHARPSRLRVFPCSSHSPLGSECGGATRVPTNISRLGSCATADCPFVHDPSKVAVCKDYLYKGSCPSGDFCDLSHELTPERTPICLHFAKGNCSKDDCRYTHVRVSPSALVCRNFGFYGYCEKGASCNDRHVNECPDFSNTGTCTTEGCKLLHKHRASVMRSNPDPTQHPLDYMIQDVSSDEEDVGSDIDSDGLEFFGDEDGEIDEDIPKQQDFVSIA